MNQTNSEQRLDFVHTTIRQNFGLTTAAIHPIAYDPQCIFPYNNFVYRVEISPERVPDPSVTQPGTVAIPNSAQHLVMRLSNAAAGLNDDNRVQNEVAAMLIAREATVPRRIVPAVYGWANAAKHQGWILMEHMGGTPLDEAFEEMNSEHKAETLEEVARIFKAIQEFNTGISAARLCPRIWWA